MGPEQDDSRRRSGGVPPGLEQLPPVEGTLRPVDEEQVHVFYRLTPELTAGLSVANVFDDKHWESFGGDILRRRLLVSMAYSW